MHRAKRLSRIWKIFQDFFLYTRSRTISILFSVLVSRVRLYAEAVITTTHPTYPCISSSYSRQETALHGSDKVAIRGIWVIMTSVHQSTRDQQGVSWDSSCILISGGAQGEYHISIDVTSPHIERLCPPSSTGGSPYSASGLLHRGELTQ